MFKAIFAGFTILLSFLSGQSQVTIPAFTGYAVPAEKGNEDDESFMFNEKAGLQNWTNTGQQIQYYFDIKNKGQINISMLASNAVAGSLLKVELAGKAFSVAVPAGKIFKKIAVGSVQVTRLGFYVLKISSVKKAGKTVANIQSIELSGDATKDIHFNAKARRNAASVHLRYTIADTAKAVAFYNELTVPTGEDPVQTYYMACGFARGYFGMQVNSEKERRVIFSVWDAGNETTDRNKVAAENKVQLLAKGADVIAEGFGNEGTGGHSHWVYNWKPGETYKFMVTALPDSASNSTIYTGYFYVPGVDKWKLIAAFRAPSDGKYLDGLYSFVENFWGVNGQLHRKALFGNQWTRNENGNWNELTSAKFSYDATGKGDRIDYGGGTENGKFYLWNGGYQDADAKYGDIFLRGAGAKNPLVDLYKNIDSSSQATIDRIIINEAVSSGKIDTAGSKDGVYYQVLKEGNGSNVQVSDTVIAYYKGSLMNGEVFDQTKDKPATFPLNRLIKGWQIGVPLCKVGGKIRLIIPSALAYSIRTRSPKIPPNSVLLFEIEVVDVKKQSQ